MACDHRKNTPALLVVEVMPAAGWRWARVALGSDCAQGADVGSDRTSHTTAWRPGGSWGGGAHLIQLAEEQAALESRVHLVKRNHLELRRLWDGA